MGKTYFLVQKRVGCGETPFFALDGIENSGKFRELWLTSALGPVCPPLYRKKPPNSNLNIL